MFSVAKTDGIQIKQNKRRSAKMVAFSLCAPAIYVVQL